VIVGRKGAYRGVHFWSGRSWTIDTAFYTLPKGECDIRWIFYTLRQVDINSMDSGSAIPSTSRHEFYATKALRPPEELQRKFSELCLPFWKRIEANLAESETLAELRDTLLPKLISGELRIPEAEEIVSSPTQLELPQSS